MDQIKPVIEWCKRNVFWIGCFLLSVTMIGSWVFSSLQLASLQKERENEITKQEKAIDKIKKTSAEEEVKAHPNDSTKAGMDAEIDNTIRAIVTAWKQRYNEQKTILTWPEDILGKETADFFSKVDVPEKLSDPGQGFEKYRKAFYDRIPKYMNKICREVGTNWQYDPEFIEDQKVSTEEEEGGPGGMYGSGPMGGMGMGAPGGETDAAMINQLNKYAVTWETTNQALWQRKLTEFNGYDDHPGGIIYPTFMQANMLQQDLWLLEAMFKNIKEVNAGSSSNDLSVIRNIYHVVFGREANAKLGELAEVDSRIFSRVQAVDPNAMGMPGMGGPMGPGDAMAGAMAGYENMAEMMAGGGGAGFVGERSAYDRRYVDTAYEPIEASKVKLVLGGATLPEQNLELIVAKRVPFRLAVKMDERKINEFIAICANSEFVFEVNQVRINRYDGNEEIRFNGGATSTAGGGGMAGMYGGMGGGDKLGGGMGMGLSLGGPGGENSGPSEALKPTPVESRTDFMVDVEYYGVVKIYNPVRENFLRLAAGQEVIDETADAELEEEAKADAAATAAAAGQPAAAQPNAGAPAQPAAGAPAQPANGAPAQPANGDAADPNAAQAQDNATTS